MKAFVPFFAIAALASSSVWAQDAQPSANPSLPAPAQEQAGTPGTQDFVTKVEGGNQYEIQASQIAEKQAKSARVKEFARRMVRDHTKAGKELTAAVKRDKAANLPSDTPIPSDLQTKLDQLKSAQGADFDTQYVQQMLQDHQDAAPMFTAYAKGGDDKIIKAFARRTAPVIRSHLEMVEKLDRQMGSKS